MGGTKEDVIQPSQQQMKQGEIGPGATPPEQLEEIIPGTQKIRFHQSGGEIHFHVDAEKLKVAMPIGEWSLAWQNLSNLRRLEYSYVDRKNSTHLFVQVGLNNGQLECSVSIKQAELGNAFLALDKFTNS